MDNNIAISKNNILSLVFKNLRAEAIENGIEKEISKLITEKNVFIISDVLKKHKMDYYDYMDKIAVLEDQFAELYEKIEKLPIILRPICYYTIETIHYKNILSGNNFLEMKNIFNIEFLGLIKNKNKMHVKNFISLSKKYFDNIETFFSQSFQDDYYKLNNSVN